MAPTIQRFNQTNKVAALIDTATISIDCNVVEIGILTSLSQTSQFANPTGNPTNGQQLQIRLTSSISRNISFGTAYQTASSLLLPSITTGNNFEDYITFRYNSTDLKWDLIHTTINTAPAISSGITRSILNINTVTTGAASSNIDYVYICSGTFTYTQPTALGNTNRYTIKNIGTGVITIVFTSGQNADGSTTITLNPEVSLDFISNNTNWSII